MVYTRAELYRYETVPLIAVVMYIYFIQVGTLKAINKHKVQPKEDKKKANFLRFTCCRDSCPGFRALARNDSFSVPFTTSGFLARFSLCYPLEWLLREGLTIY